MNTSHRRWIAWGGALTTLALLGGCVATGPVGYDDYPYDPYYGTGQVDVDIYSAPVYRTYPAVPYYGPRYGPGYRYDPRWRGDRRVTPVPVPVPVPVPGAGSGRPPGPGWQGRPPVAQPVPPILRPAPGQPPVRAAPPSPAGRGWLQGGQPQRPGDAP